MRFEFEIEKLLPIVSAMQGFINPKQAQVTMQKALFQFDGNKLTLVGSDLESQILFSTDLPTSEAFSFLVDHKKMLEVLRVAKSGVYECSHENNTLTLKRGQDITRLLTTPADEYSLMKFQLNSSQAISLGSRKLASMLAECAHAMAQSDPRMYFNGMLFDCKPESFTCVATDGFRMALSEHAFPEPTEVEGRLIVPRRIVLELSRLLAQFDGTLELVFDNKHLQIKHPEFEASTRLIAMSYPNYEKVIPEVGDDDYVEISVESLKEALEKARIVAQSGIKDHSVALEFNHSQLVISSKNNLNEESKAEISCDSRLENFKLIFNDNFLDSVLNVITTDTLYMSIANDETGVLICNAEDTMRKFVVMPFKA